MDVTAAIELAALAFGAVGVLVTIYAGLVAAIHLLGRELGRSRLH